MRRTNSPKIDIAKRRLAAQHLIQPVLTDPAEVVRSLGAVQAQDFAGAKWALGMRTKSSTDRSIERAFAEGSIIRTHVLRPTWHFVAPQDIRWMLALTGPRVKRMMAYYDRQLGLDDALLRRATAVIVRELQDGNQLTRAEIAHALMQAGIDVTGSPRLGQILMRPELDGVICSGARRGKQFTYALLDERVPATSLPGRDESLLELTRRYFTTRGPATVNDFSWWSGLTVGDAKRGVELAGAALEREIIDDRPHWSDPAARSLTWRSPKVFLLPNYDELFIGLKDRGAFGVRIASLPSASATEALGVHIVSVDGQLVGGWRRLMTKDAVTVELRLLARLTGAERRALQGAAKRLGDFIGTSAGLREVPRGVAGRSA